jgi:hypothetical protein
MSLQIERGNEPTPNEKRMAESQKWVFFATFMNYAMAHWTRKSYTNVKVELMTCKYFTASIRC